ncbi:hypothetical protein F1C76_13245 [Geodermatophilaceae bacterium NBWT11]|nr:hypothetical protein F1C76_13245 [Geodermatophilaceae bacterium NBWT11]
MHKLIEADPGVRAAKATEAKAEEALAKLSDALRDRQAEFERARSNRRAHLAERAAAGDYSVLAEPEPVFRGEEQLHADLQFAVQQARVRAQAALAAAAERLLPEAEALEASVHAEVREVDAVLRGKLREVLELREAVGVLRRAAGSEPLEAIPPRDTAELLRAAASGESCIRDAREVDAAAFEPPRRTVRPEPDSPVNRVVPVRRRFDWASRR